MRAAVRGVRNVYRNPLRAALVLAIVALAVAVFLTLARAAQAVSARTEGLGAIYENLIEVRAAGATGMGVGADALPEQAFLQPASRVEGIRSVEPYLFQRTEDPSKPVSIMIFVGVRPGEVMRVATHGEVGAPRIVAGRALRPEDAGRPVAVIGTIYAKQYGLSIGERFTVPPERVLLSDRPSPDARVHSLTLKVVGIFDAGFTFGNAQVFLPLRVAQKAFDQEGKITHIFVTAASAADVDRVQRDLREVFGDRADVISGQTTARQFASTLGAIERNSVVGALVALAVAALVVGFAMALVASERRQEVGVLKALGARNGDVVGQFLAEGTAIALTGTLAGFALFLAFGELLGRALLGRAAAAIPTMTALGENPLQAIGIEFGASALTASLVIGTIVLLAAAANLLPVIRTLQLQPVEAMRGE